MSAGRSITSEPSFSISVPRSSSSVPMPCWALRVRSESTWLASIHLFHPKFSTKCHFKQLCTTIELLKHPFVIGRGKIRNRYFERGPFPFCAPIRSRATLLPIRSSRPVRCSIIAGFQQRS